MLSQFLHLAGRPLPARALIERSLAVPSAGLCFLLGLQWSLFIATVFFSLALLGAGLYYWQPRNRTGPATCSAGLSARSCDPLIPVRQSRVATHMSGGRHSSANPYTADFDDIVTQGRDQLQQIRRLAAPITEPDFREALARICKVGDQVISLFENGSPQNTPGNRSPGHASENGSPGAVLENGSPGYLAGRRFVDTELTATLRIVSLYQNLARRAPLTEKERAVLERTARMLPEIEAAFQRQLSRLQENRYLSLETELAILEESIRTDGF